MMFGRMEETLSTQLTAKKSAEQTFVFGLIFPPQQHFTAGLNLIVGCCLVAHLKNKQQEMV